MPKLIESNFNEEITNVSELNSDEIVLIAKNFSNNFISNFKHHDITYDTIYNSILNAKMFKCDFKNSRTHGKYLYEKNEIYFSNDSDFENLDSNIYHELIHYIQSAFSKNGKLIKMGLFTPARLFSKDKNLGLNEAAVQLIASKMANSTISFVKYYGLEFITPSNMYYPIETALINQIAYFTGEYSLINSTILNNDVFEVTFKNIMSEEIFNTVSTNLDKIISMQDTLALKYQDLANFELKDDEKILFLNTIKSEKDTLRQLVIDTQKLIYENAFNYELSKIENFSDILAFQNNLNIFDQLVIKNPEEYGFEQFKDKMMFELKNKFELIEAYGNYSFAQKAQKELINLPVVSNLSFINSLFNKIKLLVEVKLRLRFTENALELNNNM